MYYTGKRNQKESKNLCISIQMKMQDNVSISACTMLTNIIKISLNLIDTKILKNAACIY